MAWLLLHGGGEWGWSLCVDGKAGLGAFRGAGLGHGFGTRKSSVCQGANKVGKARWPFGCPTKVGVTGSWWSELSQAAHKTGRNGTVWNGEKAHNPEPGGRQVPSHQGKTRRSTPEGPLGTTRAPLGRKVSNAQGVSPSPTHGTRQPTHGNVLARRGPGERRLALTAGGTRTRAPFDRDLSANARGDKLGAATSRRKHAPTAPTRKNGGVAHARLVHTTGGHRGHTPSHIPRYTGVAKNNTIRQEPPETLLYRMSRGEGSTLRYQTQTA